MFFLFFNLHSFKHIVSAFDGLEGFCRWSVEASCDGWSAAGELAAWWPLDSPDCDRRDWRCWRSRSNPSSRFCSQSLQSTSSHWRAMALLHSFLQVSQMGMLHDRELMWAQGVRMFITLLNVLKKGSGIKSPWNYPPSHTPATNQNTNKTLSTTWIRKLPWCMSKESCHLKAILFTKHKSS